MSKNKLIGPPEQGPLMSVKGKGLYLLIRVNDKHDMKIVNLFMKCAERRRFGKQGHNHD